MSSLSRRNFLKNLAACSCTTAAYGSLPFLFPQSAQAAVGNGTKVLFVNMNGGWDGLYILQPNGGSVYDTLSTLRPTLKTDPAQLLSAGSGFGFHPSLTSLKAAYDEGSLLSILNVGYDNMSRSHQDAEVAFARGVPDRLSPQASGFVNRLGARNSWNSMQAVCVSGADPSFDGGEYRGIQVSGLSNFRYRGDPSQGTHENRDRNAMLYSASQDWALDSSKPRQSEVTSAVSLAVNSSDSLYAARQAAVFNPVYPNNSIGRAFRDVDVLFSNPSLGTELAYIRRGGFDTHSDQAATLATPLSQVNAGLLSFIANMKAKNIWNKLVIVVVSEFGRTNEENGSGGTDHGGALPFIVLGGAVNGGLIGNVTSADLTDNGWLPMKINVLDFYRQLVVRMGYDPNAIFSAATDSQLNGIFKA